MHGEKAGLVRFRVPIILPPTKALTCKAIGHIQAGRGGMAAPNTHEAPFKPPDLRSLRIPTIHLYP